MHDGPAGLPHPVCRPVAPSRHQPAGGRQLARLPQMASPPLDPSSRRAAHRPCHPSGPTADLAGGHIPPAVTGRPAGGAGRCCTSAPPSYRHHRPQHSMPAAGGVDRPAVCTGQLPPRWLAAPPPAHIVPPMHARCGRTRGRMLHSPSRGGAAVGHPAGSAAHRRLSPAPPVITPPS